MTTTAVHIPVELWEALREAASRQARATGKRFSVSATITDFLTAHRAALDAWHGGRE